MIKDFKIITKYSHDLKRFVSLPDLAFRWSQSASVTFSGHSHRFFKHDKILLLAKKRSR